VRFLNRQSIRRQLPAATCVLSIPLVAPIAWSASQTRLGRLAEIKDQPWWPATAAAELDQYFAGVDALASVLARHPMVTALEHDKADPFFARDALDRQMEQERKMSEALQSLRSSPSSRPSPWDRGPALACR
jgi:hypothetical protein